MNPRCVRHDTRHCQVCAQDFAKSDEALAEPRRRLAGDSFVTPENRTAALRALDKAVKHARRMGLDVTCEVTETIKTTI